MFLSHICYSLGTKEVNFGVDLDKAFKNGLLQFTREPPEVVRIFFLKHVEEL